MDDLVKRLDIKAAMIEMGEKIAWGSDTALMREARDRIEAQAAEIARLREALEFYADTSKYPAPLTGGAGALYFDCGKRAIDALGDAQ